MNRSLLKDLAKGKFEKTENGIFVPVANVMIGGAFVHWLNDDYEDRQVDCNIVVNEGLNHILDVTLSAATQLTSWYVGIFKNNYTPVAGDVASTFAGSGKANEITTEIDETTRPAWTEAGPSSQTITNSASPAAFTANTTVTAYGAFLISNNTKGGLTGTLMAASKFAAQRDMVSTDVLNVTYTLSIADA